MFFISYFNNLSKPMRKSLLITVIALSMTTLFVLFMLLPTRRNVHAQKLTIQKLTITHASMRADIDAIAQQTLQTDQIFKQYTALHASGVLAPLLGSFAMRGKVLLDPIATQSGFIINSVKELAAIPLLIPTPAPQQLYARQPIEFTGHGSYDQIVAFIKLTETNQPLATLSSTSILSEPKTPESHKAIIAFEWPIKEAPKPLKTPDSKPSK